MRRIIRMDRAGASALAGALALCISVGIPAWAHGAGVQGQEVQEHGAPGQGAPAGAAASDSLFRAGRAALNQGEYLRAVELFQAVRTQEPPSPHLAEALYWEAFALYRLGSPAQYRSALALLERQRAEFPEAATAADARALTSRIQGQLARQGDAAAAAAIGEAAAAAARPPEPLAPVVVPIPPSADRSTGVHQDIASVQRELATVQRGAASIQREVAAAHREVAAVHRDVAAVHREVARTRRGASGGALEDLPEGCPRDDAEIRGAALNALLMIDAERALPVLRQVLERRDPCSTPLRRTAVFLVAQKPTPDTERLLLETARTDPDLQVRKNAVFYLSQVGSERSVEVLEEILRTPADSALQEQALFALSQQSDERARRTLRNYAARSDLPERLRGLAIFWVGQDGSTESQAFLRQLYRELQDEQLKGRVLFSVSQSADAETTRWLLDVALDADEAKQSRTTALFHAGTSPNLAIGDLIALYNRLPEQELKRQLLFTLAQREEPEAVDKLIEIARRDPDLSQRKQAIYWLSQTGDQRVAELLLELLGGT